MSCASQWFKCIYHNSAHKCPDIASECSTGITLPIILVNCVDAGVRGCEDNVEGGWVSSVLGAEVAVRWWEARSVSNLCPQLTVLTRSVTSQSSLVSVDNSWPWDRWRPWPPSPSPCWSAATTLQVPEKIFRYCEKIFRYVGSCFGASVFLYAPSLAIAIT